MRASERESGNGIEGLDHVNLRTSAERLDTIARFYVDVLGLTDGPRPNGRESGRWLYAGARAVLHLSAVASTPPAQGRAHAGFDHIAFRTHGAPAFRERLARLGIAYRDSARPSAYQIVLEDPDGTRIELNFPPEEAGA